MNLLHGIVLHREEGVNALMWRLKLAGLFRGTLRLNHQSGSECFGRRIATLIS